jgi:hypothetical protein
MRRETNGYSFGERARHHAEEIFGIEDEVFPDPAWQKFWFSDDPDEPRPQGGTFHPPGWMPPSEDDPPEFKSWRLSQTRRIAYHEAMMRKYTRAARYPWEWSFRVSKQARARRQSENSDPRITPCAVEHN